MTPKKTTDLIEASAAPLPAQVNAEQLLAQAIDKGVPVETMEKLLAMRRELKAEWAKEQYDKAMAAFQAACPTITKTKEVRISSGAVAYRYAPIESIVDQVKEALQVYGFSYATAMELIDDKVKVTVRVTHQAGHSEATEMTVPLGTKTNVMSQSQVVAAAQTFAKRYAFCNAFGILTGDDDNDGATTELAEKKEAKAEPHLPPPPKIGHEQFDTIISLMTELGIDRATTEEQMGKSLADISASQADTIIGRLRKKRDEQKPAAQESLIDEAG